MRGGGARQWRVPCPHVRESPHLDAELTMASQVSRANLEFFISERRVADGLSESDLERYYETAQEAGGSLVCCNSCDRLLLAGIDGQPEVLHDGQPSGDPQTQSADAEVIG